MGNKIPSGNLQERQINEKIKERLLELSKSGRFTKRVLLLSTKSAGNTTICRSVSAYSSSHKRETRQLQHQCLEMAMNLCQMTGDHQSYVKLQSLFVDKENDLADIAMVISNVWNRKTCQQKYSYRHIDRKYGDIMMDNIAYFFDKIGLIMSPKYTPIEEDIRRCHIFCGRAIAESECANCRIFMCKLIDVPTYYLNNIKKRGYMVFDNVDVVIFIVSLSDYAVYNQSVSKNAMKHSMEMFDTVLNCKWLDHGSSIGLMSLYHTEVILFLNKSDIFKEQIKNGISLSECFSVADGWHIEDDYGNIKLSMSVPCIVRNVCKETHMEMAVDIILLIQKYVGVTDKDEAELDAYCSDGAKFIQNKFEMLIKNKNKHVYSYITCGIDKDHMAKIFWDVRQIMMRRGS